MDVDQISQLPDHIIHKILSFLPTKDLVRVSILSKEWYRLFTCFPISDFSNSSFRSDEEPVSMAVRRRLEFAKFVYSSLLRQSLQSRCIPKFQLCLSGKLHGRMRLTLPKKIKVLINRSIRLCTQYGIKELALEFGAFSSYRVPESMFFLAEQLVVCRLANCIISAPTSTINWPSLREFYLTKVNLRYQRIINNLTFTCPLMEKFALDMCSGVGCLRLSGFMKLKDVEVKETPTKKIVIDALNLQTFSYFASFWDRETQINMSNCKNLQVLKVYHSYFTGRAAQDLISEFPALKFLELVHNDFESIRISNPQLEKLELVSHYMVESNIDAPRLKFLDYVIIEKIPSLFSLKTTSLHEVRLSVYRPNCDFHELEKFLWNFNQIKLVTLYISFYIDRQIARNIISNISSPIEVTDINYLKLDIELRVAGNHVTAEAAQEALVDYVFFICHPKSLRVVSGWDANNEFMTFLCKKLVLREKGKLCCVASKVKCWLHYLEGFKIEVREKKGDSKVLTCDSLLDSLQTLTQHEKIYIAFEW